MVRQSSSFPLSLFMVWDVRLPFASEVAFLHAAHGGSDMVEDRAQPDPIADVERLRQRGNDAFHRCNYARAADLYGRVCTTPYAYLELPLKLLYAGWFRC
jgi:hypothetical protein